MNIVRVVLFLSIMRSSISLSIPLIRDVYLKALSANDTNTIVRSNTTCDACLCEAFNTSLSTAYVALNCFNNQDMCEFFQNFPPSYKVKSSVGSQLYFLQNTYPAPSQCCVPNITDLLTRLTNATSQIMNLPFQPASFGYDELNPNEAVVSAWSGNPLYWFDPSTMIYLRNTSLVTGLTIALYNNQTFTSVTASRSIHVRGHKDARSDCEHQLFKFR
jgi:hypothetical protein